MNNTPIPTYYEPLEEKLNVLTHGFGILASILALVLLVDKSYSFDNSIHSISLIIYGLSLVILYTASTLYHSAKDLKLRTRLNIFDHASIYVLIAGTYTPITLIALGGDIGWWICGINWSLAFMGIIYKLFFTGRFDTISTIIYVLMGWLIIVAINPLIEGLGNEGTLWLFLGGIAYTAGAVLYSIPKVKYNHAIFHVFVLIGSFCHFISIYYYAVN